MANDLEFRIGAELGEIKAAIASLRRDFVSVGDAANKAGGGNAFSGIESGSKSALGTVGRLAAGLASIATVVAVIGKADELNTLNARLRLVTEGTEGFTRAQVELFDISQRTRSSYGETIKLYAQTANAVKDAKVGQEVILSVVETINKAVQLSGAAPQAAEAALVQLGQGLASGTLRGEELNSVLEQTPALADAIAKGMGITRGELRKYGEEGKISAQQVIGALEKQKGEVDRQFSQLPLTVGQSITLLKNAGTQLLGVFDEVSSSTSGLAEVIKGLADFLSSDEVAGAIVEFASLWSNAFRDIAADVKDAVRIIEDATAGIAGTSENLIQLLIRAFKELPVNLRAIVRVVTVTFAGMVDSFIADAKLMKEAFAAIFTDDTIEAAIARRNARVNASMAAVKESIDGILQDRDAALAEGKKAATQAQARRASGRVNTGANSRGTFKPAEDKKAAAEALALEKAKQDGIEKLAKDSADRQIGALKEFYEDAAIAASDYYARRQRIEIESIDAQIAAQRKLSTIGSPADKQKALTEIELLERQKGDVRNKAAREAFLEAKEIAKQLEQAQAQDLENQGRSADAAKIRLEAQYRDLIKRLEADGNKAGANLLRKLINAGGAKAEFDQLEREFQRVTQNLQRRQAAIADQVKTGSLSSETGGEQGRTARAEALQQLDDLNTKMQALAASTNDPAIKQGAAEAAAAIRQMAIDSAIGVDAAVISLRAALDNMKQGFAQTVTDAGVDAFTNLFSDLASNTKSAGDAVKDFARSFATSMLQIAARALATYAVLQLLEAVFPGAGKLVGATASVGVKHSGGMVGQGTRRDVSPLLFAGAPRFHGGSDVLGLKPGEIPTILQEGERVQSRQEVASTKGGSSGGGTRIINVIDPALVQDYMTSASGERTILNVIERNAGSVRQKLA